MNVTLRHLDETLSLGVELRLQAQTCGLGWWRRSVIGLCPTLTIRPLPGPSTLPEQKEQLLVNPCCAGDRRPSEKGHGQLSLVIL